jgi:hypothetical protein
MKSQLCVMLLAAAGLGGCGAGGDGGGAQMPPSSPAPPAALSFTSFSKQIVGEAEDALPAELDSVTFTFDGDDDPAAYDELLTPTS